jgi:hypothetical protein
MTVEQICDRFAFRQRWLHWAHYRETSTSPSESAPSAPGGGGKTLADCMGFWDKATHMTKAEWKAACLRTMTEFPDIMR